MEQIYEFLHPQLKLKWTHNFNEFRPVRVAPAQGLATALFDERLFYSLYFLKDWKVAKLSNALFLRKKFGCREISLP